MPPTSPRKSFTLWQKRRKSRGRIGKMLQAKDYIVAGTPVAASITLSQVNQVAALVGTLLGIAYLLWKWRREAK